MLVGQRAKIHAHQTAKPAAMQSAGGKHTDSENSGEVWLQRDVSYSAAKRAYTSDGDAGVETELVCYHQYLRKKAPESLTFQAPVVFFELGVFRRQVDAEGGNVSHHTHDWWQQNPPISESQQRDAQQSGIQTWLSAVNG